MRVLRLIQTTSAFLNTQKKLFKVLQSGKPYAADVAMQHGSCTVLSARTIF